MNSGSLRTLFQSTMNALSGSDELQLPRFPAPGRSRGVVARLVDDDPSGDAVDAPLLDFGRQRVERVRAGRGQGGVAATDHVEVARQDTVAQGAGGHQLRPEREVGREAEVHPRRCPQLLVGRRHQQPVGRSAHDLAKALDPHRDREVVPGEAGVGQLGGDRREPRSRQARCHGRSASGHVVAATQPRSMGAMLPMGTLWAWVTVWSSVTLWTSLWILWIVRSAGELHAPAASNANANSTRIRRTMPGPRVLITLCGEGSRRGRLRVGQTLAPKPAHK